MLQKLKDRNNQIIISFVLIFLILIFRLSLLTIVNGDMYREISENRREKKIPIIAKRGEIRDRNGELLATSIPSFTVQLIRSDLPQKQLFDISIKILNILDEMEEKYIEFPIDIKENDYYYTYDKEIEEWIREDFLKNYNNDTEIQEWLNDNGYESLINDAESVFKKIVDDYVSVEGLNNYEAQKVLISQGIVPPISVKDEIKFTPQIEKEKFLQYYGLELNTSPEEAFKAIKEKYKIGDEYTNEDALKIMTILHALSLQGYMQYEPLKIASNISHETAILIEEMGMELPGITVVAEPIRYYPNGNLASHILGYLGKIATSTEEETYIKNNGYPRDAIIGKTGIEGKYELQLQGENGYMLVEVDAYGRTVKELDSIKQPEPGEDIYLTIDTQLQKVAEDALEKALMEIQVGGKFESQWGNYNYSESFPKAKAGTAVAVDVKTGEVLALANYPSYDPNLFSTGISGEDWGKLQPENKRDPIAPRPLYNIAAYTAVQPGSTFKMITGLAAIEQGLDPNRKLYDGGAIRVSRDKTFGCWIWNDYRGSHGYVDLYKAIEVSCNYYFYDLAGGRDFYKDEPLGIEMNTEIFLDYAKRFGLGEKTGIETGEVAYGIPDPDRKARTIKALLERKLEAVSIDYFNENILEDDEKISNYIDEIVGWADENPSRAEIIRRLKELEVKDEKLAELADLVKYSYYNQIDFQIGDAFNLAIGQGSHAYTPLQMARYISAIANGGYLNNLSVVKKVGDDIQSNNLNSNRVPLNDYENLEHIKKGMLQVTQGESGTARTVFKDFPITVSAKTGTAERHGKIPLKSTAEEVDYIKENFREIVSKAPYLTIDMVEEEANRILEEEKERINELLAEDKSDEALNIIINGYLDEDYRIRKAIKNLSNNKISDSDIDRFKEDYDNFAWSVSFAPYDDPQIAVVVLLFQGGHGGYGTPVAREIMAEYFNLTNNSDQINPEGREED